MFPEGSRPAANDDRQDLRVRADRQYRCFQLEIEWLPSDGTGPFGEEDQALARSAVFDTGIQQFLRLAVRDSI